MKKSKLVAITFCFLLLVFSVVFLNMRDKGTLPDDFDLYTYQQNGFSNFPNVIRKQNNDFFTFTFNEEDSANIEKQGFLTYTYTLNLKDGTKLHLVWDMLINTKKNGETSELDSVISTALTTAYTDKDFVSLKTQPFTLIKDNKLLLFDTIYYENQRYAIDKRLSLEGLILD